MARQFVAAALAGWGSPPGVDVVVLLTSEAVTNVVVHAGPHGPGDEMGVAVIFTAGVVRVEVTDAHPGLPVVGDGSLDELSGRGILLLDALASAWGVRPNGHGKVVWFEVAA